MTRIVKPTPWIKYKLSRLQEKLSDFRTWLGPHATPLWSLCQLVCWSAYCTVLVYSLTKGVMRTLPLLGWFMAFLIIMVGMMNLYLRGQRVGHRQIFAQWKEHNEEWRREIANAFKHIRKDAE